MSVKPTESIDPIVQRLQQAAKSSPELGGSTRLYQAILPLVRDADLGAAPLPLDPEQIAKRMESGVPILSGLDLEIDMQAAEALMQQLLGSVEALDELAPSPARWAFWQRSAQRSDSADQTGFASLKSAARQIRLAFEAERIDVAQVLAFATTGDCKGLSERAQGEQLDPDLLWTMARNCIKPALQSWRRQIHPPPEEINWPHGYCFICGATATLGELQDNAQAKHLRCSLCGADWPFPILQCLQCGNEDHRSRPHFYQDGHSDRRVEACDACHSYHKVITAFTPTQPELLVVEDLLSLHLDFIARQRGYVKANGQWKIDN